MKIKQVFLNVGVVLTMLVLSINYSNAQTKGGVDVIGKKVEATRGAVKHERPTKDVEAQKEDASRGACCLGFDNYTGYYLDVWVDDVYRGRVAPYKAGDICVANGFTTYYVETAGGTYYWDGSGDCQSSYNIKLQQ